MEGAISFRLEQRFVEASYVEHIESQSLAGHGYIKSFSAGLQHRRRTIGADKPRL